MKLSRNTRIIIVAGAPLALLALFLLRDFILPAGHYFPCIFRRLTGLLCPGCGNTRAVDHLVHGRVWLALRSNPDIPVLIAVAVGFYAELAADISGRKLKIVPRSMWFWCPIFAAFGVFYILRNIFPVLAPP